MAKLYYSIKEVSEEIDEEQHVLRYWEKEFSILKPKKNKAGNRTYSQKDILILFKIKDLIRDQRLPVKEVKEILKKIKWNEETDRKNEFIKSSNVSIKSLEVVSEINEEVENGLSESKSNVDGIDVLNNIEAIKEVTEDFVSENVEVEPAISIGHYKEEFKDESDKINLDNIVSIDNVTNNLLDSEIEKVKDTVENIEKSLNLEIDKKIILKNHLFEDFEEFSIIPSDYYINEKEKTEKEKSEKVLKDTSNENENNDKSDGIFLSNEKLGLLIDILKEIRKIVD